MDISRTKLAVLVGSLVMGGIVLSGPSTAQAPKVDGKSQMKGVKNIKIDENIVKNHVISPKHVEGVVSSKGLAEGKIEFRIPQKLSPKPHLDVDAFGKALHAALKDEVAGYVMQLRKNGTTIYTLQWQWAKYPADGSVGWNPNVRMHVASVSKLVTGIAMTRLLDNKGISYDAHIIDYLPAYWQKGPNIDKITFRHLLTHQSGFNTPNGETDFATMKAKVAAGVSASGGASHIGKYDYENMNFGLCRILISVINGDIEKNAQFPLFAQFNDPAWDYATIEAYKKYVQGKVFGPAGVSGPSRN